MADFDAICMQIKLPKGATLFEENDIGNRIIVVCGGMVKVSCTSQAGRVLIQKIGMPHVGVDVDQHVSPSGTDARVYRVPPTNSKLNIIILGIK